MPENIYIQDFENKWHSFLISPIKLIYHSSIIHFQFILYFLDF